MYVIEMKPTKQYAQGTYTFETKDQVFDFLEKLNDYEIESILSIEKYNKHSYRNAWYDFFEY